MSRNFFLIPFFIVAFYVLLSVPSYAYHMVDYWAINEGNVWVYDRDLQLTGTETHNFSGYTGRQFIQATTFNDSHFYIYSGTEGVIGVGLFIPEIPQFIDLSATPVKFSNAEMNIGESVSSSIPAGVVDDDAISFTVTLEAVETVDVTAGTYSNALRMKIVVDDGLGIYTERIWLAKNVGMVKMYKVSETNNTPGCVFACGSFDGCSEDIVNRTIQLNSFIEGGTSEENTRVVVIPLGD